MRIVQGQPPQPPHRCAVLRYKTGSNPEERFIDSGQDIGVGAAYERVYVSEAAIKEMARILGHPSSDEHTLALAKSLELEAENERLKEEMKEYDRRFEAIDVLESADFRARRKAGRPPKQPTKKAA